MYWYSQVLQIYIFQSALSPWKSIGKRHALPEWSFNRDSPSIRSTGSSSSWMSSESNYAGASVMSEGSQASFVVEVGWQASSVHLFTCSVTWKYCVHTIKVTWFSTARIYIYIYGRNQWGCKKAKNVEFLTFILCVFLTLCWLLWWKLPCVLSS